MMVPASRGAATYSREMCRTPALQLKPMTYSQTQRTKTVRRKQETDTLPPEPKLPAAYVTKNGSGAGPEHDFCLPSTYAAWSLLPEVRRSALGLLGEMGIPWHAEVDGGPSNHLLSSQVQCVNALGQMVSDRDRIRRAFGS